jgi:hypothetical protein
MSKQIYLFLNRKRAAYTIAPHCFRSLSLNEVLDGFVPPPEHSPRIRSGQLCSHTATRPFYVNLLDPTIKFHQAGYASKFFFIMISYLLSSNQTLSIRLTLSC